MLAKAQNKCRGRLQLRRQHTVSYLFLGALKAHAVPLEVMTGFLHQTIQIHPVTELQLWVPFQHDGHHHQELHRRQEERKSDTQQKTLHVVFPTACLHYDLSVLGQDDVLQRVLHQQREVHLIHGHVRERRLLQGDRKQRLLQFSTLAARSRHFESAQAHPIDTRSAARQRLKVTLSKTSK